MQLPETKIFQMHGQTFFGQVQETEDPARPWLWQVYSQGGPMVSCGEAAKKKTAQDSIRKAARKWIDKGRDGGVPKLELDDAQVVANPAGPDAAPPSLTS